jgi:uncharacterized protein (DUF305 family)
MSVVATVVLSLAACSEEPSADKAPVVQLGGPGESGRTLSEGEVDDLPGAGEHLPADVEFAQNMILHHRQALVMTALVADQSQDRDLALLAERMDVAQTDEIAQLERWLTAREEQAPGEHHHDHADDASMPGMLTDAELAKLAAADGQRFNRLFLRLMIRHHEGALVMVQQLVDAGGGQEPTMFELAQHIDADQRVEIGRMRSMLADL